MNNGRVIIIGASSGMGRELAKIFSAHGYCVGIAARRTELLAEVAKELPGKTFARKMDLAKAEEAVAEFEALRKEMGGADIVIISSGVGFLNPELDWEKERATIAVNVTGFAAIADAAMRYFLQRGSGHLVGISSIAAIRGGSDGPAYGASKAFVANYLEALRFKARGMGIPITVTDIQPGFVDTEMAKGEGLFWIASPAIDPCISNDLCEGPQSGLALGAAAQMCFTYFKQPQRRASARGRASPQGLRRFRAATASLRASHTPVCSTRRLLVSLRKRRSRIGYYLYRGQ